MRSAPQAAAAEHLAAGARRAVALSAAPLLLPPSLWRRPGRFPEQHPSSMLGGLGMPEADGGAGPPSPLAGFAAASAQLLVRAA